MTFPNENFSHEVKAETIQVLHFRNRSAAEIHKAGCAHAAKATDAYAPQPGAEIVEQTLTRYRDDYYYVAPCARKP